VPERDQDYSDAQRRLAEEVETMQRLVDDFYSTGNTLTKAEFNRLRERSLHRQQGHEREMSYLAELSVLDSLPRGEELRAMWDTQGNDWRRQVSSLAIEFLEILPFPAGVTSTVTKRKTETDAAFALRKADHATYILDERVSIAWVP